MKKSQRCYKKEFDIDPVYDKNVLKTKVKFYGYVVTDFYDKEIPKMDSNYTCLAIGSLDSPFQKDKSYYLQVFLKECKYIKEKVIRHIDDNLRDFLLTSLMKNKYFLINT